MSTHPIVKPDHLLAPGDILSFRIGADQTLTVCTDSMGMVWLTRRGDLRDYWLASGDSMSLCAGDEITISVEPTDGSVHFSLLPHPSTTDQPRAAAVLAGAGRALLPALLGTGALGRLRSLFW